jgi:RNA polymerase sigma-70 factor (ECF subfamily)
MGVMSPRNLELGNLRRANSDRPSDLDLVAHGKDHPEVDRLVTGLVHDHFDFIWRSLRRLGVPLQQTDDAAQKVFWIATQKLQGLDVERERSFLFAIALRVAADERRWLRRRREVAPSSFEELRDSAPPPDELLEQRRARDLLDRILEEMPFDLRVVFVLFELEDMTMFEVAALLEIPNGTVASRLRRAREVFDQQVARFRARRTGGTR